MALQKLQQKYSHLVGVDEAGRGPLAGPVAVGVVKVPIDFDWALVPGVGDSKQLSEKAREEVYAAASEARRAGALNWSVSLVSAVVIDKKGIVLAVTLAMHRCFKKLRLDAKEVEVKLDGSLSAPSEYIQETIVKGDAKEPVIGLASIVAKVTRDRYMRRRASLAAFAPYNFATHKGYGTKDHCQAIAEYGLSSEHRASYCKNIKLL